MIQMYLEYGMRVVQGLDGRLNSVVGYSSLLLLRYWTDEEGEGVVAV
jgi:hypothetical protein